MSSWAVRQQVRHPHLFSLSTSFSFFLSFFCFLFSSLYFLIFNFRFSYCWRSVGRQFNYKFEQASEALERRGEERRGEERARNFPGDNLANCDLSIYLFLDPVIYLFIIYLLSFLNLLADYLWRMRRSHHYYHLHLLRNCQQMHKMRVKGGSFRHGRRGRRGRQAEDRGEITGCQEEGTRGMGGDEGDRRRCQRETLREGRVRQLSRWSSQVK